MVREVVGVNGQFITTWGSDLSVEGIVVPGTDRPITTTLTCRCGETTTFAGFPSNVGRTSFHNFSGEFWCSFKCVAQYEPSKMAGMLTIIRKRAAKLAEQAQTIEEELLDRK